MVFEDPGGAVMGRVNGNALARYITVSNRGRVRMSIGQAKEALRLTRLYLSRHKGSERLEWTERTGGK